jgi:hypothetical protein
MGNYFRNTKFQYSIIVKIAQNVKGSVFSAEPFTLYALYCHFA